MLSRLFTVFGNEKVGMNTMKGKKKTHEDFLREVNELHKGRIEVIDNYVGARYKLEVKCTSCNHNWSVTPSNLLQGSGCSKCAANKMSKLREKTHNQFIDEVFDLVGNEYTILNEYISSLEKINIKHNICNYSYYVTPNNFLHGNRCPNCANKRKRTNEEYNIEIYNLVRDEYEVLGEFIDVRTKVEMYHSICNKKFNMRPQHFLSGQRCPHCAKDKKYGENSHFWKGGISPIVNRLRGFIYPWKFDSLKENKFICALSGINDGTLEVHHLNKNFSDIVYETFRLLNIEMHNDMSDYTQTEINLIKNKLLELHYFYGLGVPLRKEIHTQFHSIYGNKSNTPEQFYEFKTNYMNKPIKEVVNI